MSVYQQYDLQTIKHEVRKLSNRLVGLVSNAQQIASQNSIDHDDLAHQIDGAIVVLNDIQQTTQRILEELEKMDNEGENGKQ